MNWLRTIIEELQDTAQMFVVFLCVVVIGTMAFKTRALVPVLGAVLLSAVVMYFTSDSGLDWSPTIIEEETVGT